MAATGQTINDRLNAVRYALVGQGLARTVCKATTEEVLGPKKKHLDYLLVCTQEPNVSVPQLANLLIERTQHLSWAVVFKGLVTIHHLMAFGNERFTQYLATSNHSFSLPDFMDRSTPQGYQMSTFVRRYSKYVNDKCISYRNLAIDICKLGTGNDNPLRTMNMEKLSKTLPIVHEQYDSLLEFEADAKDLNNGIIMAAFRLLYKDLVRLYIAYQEAIINLLERYFKLSRKKTREALELYKQYLSRMDKVATFFKVADAVGLDKSEMPDLTRSPASILNLLEQHLAQLEAKKKGANQSATSPVEPQAEDDDATASTTKLEQMKLTTGNEKDSRAVSSSEELHEEQNQQQAGPSGESKKPDPSGTAALGDGKSQPTSPKVSPALQTPPKPPARPSPSNAKQTSPAPTISTLKQATPAPTKTTPTTTQPKSTNAPPVAAAAASPASGPPERPAKPPSRPPPPSAAATPSADPSVSSTPVKKTPPAHPPAPTEKKSTTPTPPAPPHPPPPSHMASHSGSTKTTTSSSPEPLARPKSSNPEPEAPMPESVEQSAAVAEELQQQDEQPIEVNNDQAMDELHAPIDANNLDRPDSGVGSPSNGSENSAHAHPGPSCAGLANVQVEQVDRAEISNHSGNVNGDQVNGHDSGQQVEESAAEPAGEAQVALDDDQQIAEDPRDPSPLPPPPPPALEEDDEVNQQQNADINHINNHNINNNNTENNNNPNEAHNGQ